MKAAGAVINEALSPGGGAPGSENGSHLGTPVHLPGHLHPTNGDIGVSAAESTEVRYGDECFYGKVSLLHFIVFFLLGGLTVLIVGAVQVCSHVAVVAVAVGSHVAAVVEVVFSRN